jgi:hypothetical protein
MKVALNLISRNNPPPLVDYSNVNVEEKDVGGLIFKKLISDSPTLISRFGSEEIKSLKEYKLRLNTLPMRYYYYKKGWINNYAPFSCNNLFDSTFRWNNFKDDWRSYYNLFVNAMSEIDVLGSWLFWEKVYQKELRSTLKVRLSRLEPYYHSINWLNALTNKKVLVIHPMKESILRQFDKKNLLFDGGKGMPDCQLSVMQALYFDDANYNTWVKIYEYYLNEVEKFDFDIVIIGNGSWGMPLGAYLKSKGKKVIHLGGAVQLLFGIMGNRWFNDYPFVRNLMNEHWIYPNPSETPKWSLSYDKKAYW